MFLYSPVRGDLKSWWSAVSRGCSALWMLHVGQCKYYAAADHGGRDVSHKRAHGKIQKPQLDRMKPQHNYKSQTTETQPGREQQRMLRMKRADFVGIV